jgi:hypothetical protein
MFEVPPRPAVPADQRAGGTAWLRYEDVSQDGQVKLLALPQAIGAAIWQTLLLHHPIARMQHTGVIPILTRFVLQGGGGPVSVRRPMTSDGCYQLAHALGADGHPDRILLNLWADLSAPRGRTLGPPPPQAGEPVVVGRVFAEHVFTRPFAPAGQRRVTRLEMPGLPELPPDRFPQRPAAEAAVLPEGARLLDDAPVVDPAQVAFDLDHTDANHHVNSLVYPRWFLDAALRRLAAHGRSQAGLATRLEVGYRKPSFAGDRLRVELSAFEHPAGCGAIGCFLPADAPKGAARAHVYLRVFFTPQG